MKKASMLKGVNVVVAVLFLSQASTGILRESIPDDLYGIVHGYVGYLFVAAVIAHVVLNWTWIRSTFFKKKQAAKSAAS